MSPVIDIDVTIIPLIITPNMIPEIVRVFGIDKRYAASEKQKMLDKENIRQWLIERGFSGEGTPPSLTDEIRISLAEQYINLYEILIGKRFEPVVGDVQARIEKNLEHSGVGV